MKSVSISKALVRLSEKVFHAFGESVKPSYPTDLIFG